MMSKVTHQTHTILISTIQTNQQAVETITLKKEDQEGYRKRFNFLNDRDYFKINSWSKSKFGLTSISLG